MTKFLFIYHAPQTPAAATPPSPEQVTEIMGTWGAWAEKVGSGMIDFGTPLAGGVAVTPTGTAASTREVAGYTLLEAESMNAALELAAAHPHLNMPGGCTIEVHEAQPVPGM